jgi:hypothetical protein
LPGAKWAAVLKTDGQACFPDPASNIWLCLYLAVPEKLANG